MSEGFQFKQFYVRHDRCAMKVGTDGVLLGALADGGSKILDIGTGSGLCAMMMAQRFPEARITGIDIDSEACQQAAENARAFSEEIEIRHTSLEDFADTTGDTFDAIISNPPYFEETTGCPDIQRDKARHASSLPYSTMLRCSKKLLSDDGTITIIIPTSAVGRIEHECAYLGLFIVRRINIKPTPKKPEKRTLLYIKKRNEGNNGCSVETQTLNTEGQRSAWYAEITKDFYL